MGVYETYESSFRIDLRLLFFTDRFCLGSERDARIYTINLLEMQSFNYVSKGLEKEKKCHGFSIWPNSLQVMIQPQ